MSATEVDKLGDRLRVSVGVDDLRLLDTYRRSFRPDYDVVVSKVRTELAAEVSGRPAKSTTAIIEKLQRGTIRLSQMQDIAGCRLVVKDVSEQNFVVAKSREIFQSVVYDRRERPSHGYRAVHVVLRASSRPVELQIRTELQHLWAELSEKFADIYDPSIKYGGGSEGARSSLDGLSSLITRIEGLEGGGYVGNELADIKEDLRKYLEKMIFDIGR